jgi:16S rRNA (guanine1516-N2)-methyltransferase
MNSPVAVFSHDPTLHPAAVACAAQLQVDLDQTSPDTLYHLHFTSATGVYLEPADGKKHGRIQVDFCAGGASHRRLYGGGKGQMIAKAVGLATGIRPQVFDATAGLGGDAFVLACLGCQVTMMERSPVAYALLQDGLSRARAFALKEDAELADIIGRMQLLPGDSIAYLQGQIGTIADVIYLDPMFPERQKSAAVKKEMQAFHRVIGQDLDEEALLRAALARAGHRVVVKRSRHAPAIGGAKPHYALEGKSSRFDIHVLKSFSRS